MPNPYRDLMNQGRVASGSPPERKAGPTRPARGPVPPGPFPKRRDDAPAGTPLGTQGFNDMPDIIADPSVGLAAADAAAASGSGTPQGADQIDLQTTGGILSPIKPQGQNRVLANLKAQGLGPDGEPLSPEPAANPVK